MLEPISENTIKRATLQFLKAYYKFLPRTGEQIAGFDIESERGIIVDGYISVPNNEHTFSATFEATSIDTIDEIRYKRQPSALMWDSFAVGSLITAVVFSACYIFNYLTIRDWGVISIAMMVIGFLVLMTAIYWNIVKDFQRYRYIYAVEQFKRYQADEQWVAIGEDVFPDFGNPYLKELKRQCVHHGFGLLRVNSDREAQLLITPSKEEILKNRRNLSGNKNSFYNRIIGNRVNDAFSKMNKSSAFNNSYLRFRRSYFKQIVLSLIGAGIIGGLFYKEVLDADINYVNEKMYEKEMMDMAKEIRPENKQYIIDRDEVEPFEEVDRNYVDAQTEHLYEKGGMDIATIELNDPRDSKMQFYVGSDDEFTSYDCARLFNFKGTKYLIQDQTYEEATTAKRRVELLKSNGIDANLLWLGCFYKKEKNYVVYIDLLHNDVESAKKTARQYRNAIKVKSIKAGNLAIRKLSR